MRKLFRPGERRDDRRDDRVDGRATRAPTPGMHRGARPTNPSRRVHRTGSRRARRPAARAWRRIARKEKRPLSRPFFALPAVVKDQ
ncbi:hypothetical protein ARC20_00155 [Stenotrophomonas panacihumi]|uniref:Uncharacterized protein n=2 Tax=Stenotrophomonas panacihumi TaxID=676599 RepID=A0A0R0AYH7_9GAMM|nr:hypothetical protein ARC20_00155 [Stenotrophomonas panacihumi]PTN53210.1 hypothetical protein C9J98_16930 [Stenotrophomonas panacihumi]